MKKVLALSVVAVLMLALLTSCFGGRDIDEDLVGTWYAPFVGEMYTLNDDGTGTMFGVGDIEWWVDGDNFYVRVNGESTGFPYTYENGVFTTTVEGVELELTNEPSEFEMPDIGDLETPDFGLGGDEEATDTEED